MEQVKKQFVLNDKKKLNSTIFAKAISSFDKQINQMSTPLHHQPNDTIVKGNDREKLLFAFLKLNFI